MQIFEMVVLTLSTVFAAVAAIAACKSARASSRAARAQVVGNLLDVYSSQDMLQALRKLFDWRKAHPQDFAKKFAQLRRKNYGAVEELDAQRRRVKCYFLRVFQMYRTEVLKEADVREVVHAQQAFCLLEIIQPIELTMNKNTPDKAAFKYFEKLYPDSEEGDFGGEETNES